jgi:hypothetical protein
MGYYVERRLQELRDMTTEAVAKRPIRSTTHPRIKEVILSARKRMSEHGESPAAKLKNGDVLLLHKHQSFFPKFISWVTRSPYVHAGVYNKGKVYDALSQSGIRNPEKDRVGGNINSLDDFVQRDRGLTYDVYRPKDRKAAREAARNIERMTAETKGYAVSNAVQAGLRDRFGFAITTNHNKNYRICSELVYDCFNGTIGSDSGSTVSPGRLAKNPHLEKVHSLKLSLSALNDAFNELR